MALREIDWRYVEPTPGWEAYERDVVTWVDVAVFDRAWQLTEQYIRPGGSNGQGDRYNRAGIWFAINSHSDMLEASFDEVGVVFSDGRHRFSWLRDHGVMALPLQISPAEAVAFEQRFGTPLRQSIMPE